MRYKVLEMRVQMERSTWRRPKSLREVPWRAWKADLARSSGRRSWRSWRWIGLIKIWRNWRPLRRVQQYRTGGQHWRIMCKETSRLSQSSSRNETYETQDAEHRETIAIEHPESTYRSIHIWWHRSTDQRVSCISPDKWPPQLCNGDDSYGQGPNRLHWFHRWDSRIDFLRDSV